MNFTISSNYKLNKIVDSFKGIEDIEIDAKEIEEGVYDFIVSFKTSDDKIFHKKLRELFQIKKEDFPGTTTEVMRKFIRQYNI